MRKDDECLKGGFVSHKRSILVQFLRHCGFWLTTNDDVNILIDPILSFKDKAVQLVPPPFEPTAIEKTDAILITHLHPDHWDRETVFAIAQRTGAEVIAPLDAINELNLPSIKTRGVKSGDSLMVKSIEIRASSVGTYVWGEEKKDNIGFKLVTEGEIRLFHASDCFPQPADIGEINIFFVRFPTPGAEKLGMTKGRMIELIRKTQPQFVIPMHYGTYTSIRVDPEELRNEIETEKTKMLLFYPGQIRRIQISS